MIDNLNNRRGLKKKKYMKNKHNNIIGYSENVLHYPNTAHAVFRCTRIDNIIYTRLDTEYWARTRL